MQFWTDVQHRISTLPGVASVAVMGGLPPVRPVNANDTQVEGWVDHPSAPPQNIDYWQAVGNRFFATMGIRLIEGRFFDDRDGANAPLTLIVNQTTARMYWPGQSAIGHRMKPGFQGDWRTIVGVVADVKNAGIDQPTGTELFFPYRQSAGQGLRNGYLVIRGNGDSASLAGPARPEIRARRNWRTRSHAPDPRTPVRYQCIRSADLHRHGRAPHCRDRSSLLHPGAPRNKGGPHRSATIRVATCLSRL